jgi:phosphoribosyl 1,2-cyclic phosphodiesterase
MRFSVLASGSQANCTLVEHEGEGILIDCGLSAKQTSLRMAKLGVTPEIIRAIVVTHEHGDHIRGIPVFSRRFEVPVYVTDGAAGFLKGVSALSSMQPGRSFWVGPMLITRSGFVSNAPG